MSDFNTDMRENETGFRPDKYEPRAMRMSFERGQGGASLPNFKETVARLNADSADKQAGQDLLTLGRVADRLNIAQKAQEDILSQKLRALPLPEQVNQLANDFEQSLLDDPNLPYRDNRDSLGGLGRAVYSREMELRRRQFEEGQKPEEQDSPAASFYPRKSVDYIHPENNQPTQSPKPEPRSVKGTVIGLDEDVEPVEPEPDEEEEDPFNGTANFNPPGGSGRPPGTPPNPPQPPEDNGEENIPPEEPIIPFDDWRPSTTENLMQEQLRIAQRSAEIEEQGLKRAEEQLQGLKASFFNDVLKQNKTISPPGNQPWFNTLNTTEQEMVNRMYYQVIGIEGKKGGAKMLDQYKEFYHVPRQELEQFWQFDSFRMTMATLMDHRVENGEEVGEGLFAYGQLNPTDTGRSDGGQPLFGLVLTDRGRELMQEVNLSDPTRPSKFDVYRQGIISRMEAYYTEHPNRIPFGFTRTLRDEASIKRGARAAAEAGFASAWGLVALSLGPEAGDTKRKVVNFDPRAFSFGWRTTLHPHDQAVKKWVVGEEKRGAEERIFGVAGPWFEERCRNNDNFRKNFETYQQGYRYFLRVTLGSAFDHTRFTDTKNTLTQTLIQSDKVSIETTAGVLVDYQGGSASIDFNRLMDGDLAAHYTDLLGNVVKMQDFLTTNEVKDPFSQYSDFLGAVLALQDRAELSQENLKDPITGQDVIDPVTGKAVVEYQDDLLVGIYGAQGDDVSDRLEDMVVNAMGVAGGGFALYSSEPMLTNTQRMSYDVFVAGLVSDARLFKILIGRERDKNYLAHLYRRVAAHQPESDEYKVARQTLFGTNAARNDALGKSGPRTEIIKRIKKEMKRLGITN